MHVDQVMAGVSRSERCPGHEAQPREGFLAKMFGR